MAMAYGNVYVAWVAFGAKDAQTVKAFREAEAIPGPSLIIAYSHCIAHGYDLAHGARAAEARGRLQAYWPLYRFDPRRIAAGENPLQSRLAAAARGHRQLHAERVPLSDGRGPGSRALPGAARDRAATRAESDRAVRATREARGTAHAGERAERDDHPSRRRRNQRIATVDLSTTYLGLQFPHPLIAGASPLVDDLDMVRRLETRARPRSSCIRCSRNRLMASGRRPSRTTTRSPRASERRRHSSRGRRSSPWARTLASNAFARSRPQSTCR